MLKKIAFEQGVEIQDGDIAINLNISIDQFRRYYSDTVETPPALFSMLREKYSHFIAGRSVHQIWFSEELDVDDPETPPPDSDEEPWH